MGSKKSEYGVKVRLGKRLRLVAETTGVRKKVGVIFERQGCQSASGKA
jgi:hypothetical protein